MWFALKSQLWFRGGVQEFGCALLLKGSLGSSTPRQDVWSVIVIKFDQHGPNPSPNGFRWAKNEMCETLTEATKWIVVSERGTISSMDSWPISSSNCIGRTRRRRGSATTTRCGTIRPTPRRVLAIWFIQLGLNNGKVHRYYNRYYYQSQRNQEKDDENNRTTFWFGRCGGGGKNGVLCIAFMFIGEQCSGTIWSSIQVWIARRLWSKRSMTGSHVGSTGFTNIVFAGRWQRKVRHGVRGVASDRRDRTFSHSDDDGDGKERETFAVHYPGMLTARLKAAACGGGKTKVGPGYCFIFASKTGFIPIVQYKASLTTFQYHGLCCLQVYQRLS